MNESFLPTFITRLKGLSSSLLRLVALQKYLLAMGLCIYTQHCVNIEDFNLCYVLFRNYQSDIIKLA